VITVADAALDYAKRGWKPVPVDRKSKKPIGRGWQKQPFDPRQFNGNTQNIALQLGAASSGLVDVDLDSMTAIGFAPDFLPPTGAIFGHRSKPCSHQLYVSLDLCESENKAALQYKDVAGAVIVELRIGGGDKGAATTVPPSMHAGTGEMIEWVRDGEPARLSCDPLKRAVLKLAVACLLKPRYPGHGSRHEGALVLGGTLARAGWAAEDIAHLVEVIARAAGDDDVRDRVTAAMSAVDVKTNGHDVAGLTRLGAVWGEDVAKQLGKWLALRPGKGGAAGLEDAVALAFAEQHANDFRYVAKSSQWMRWADWQWQYEDTLKAFDAARKLCREAGDAKARTVAAVTTLARADRRMAATIDQWDAKPEIINTPTREGAT
jgi:hypothetical protein